MSKKGIIIANTGSPAAPEPASVRAYLEQFLTDPRIQPMNETLWRLLLNTVILPKRSQASADKYRQIWTDQGSPLQVHMSSLADKLDADLEDATVTYAMSYGTPSIMNAVSELKDEGCSEICVIPLYPQSAFSTTKVVEDKLNTALQNLAWSPNVVFIEKYSDEDLYIDAIAATVDDAGFKDGDALLMAFHSIPMKDIDSGDTYAEQVHTSASAIAAKLNLADEQWRIGFQSRFDNRKWLGPSVKSILPDLAKSNGRLFVIAPNFSIDCLETLYDIDIVMKEEYVSLLRDLKQAQETSSDDSEKFVYINCLNDADIHIALLKNLIEGSL